LKTIKGKTKVNQDGENSLFGSRKDAESQVRLAKHLRVLPNLDTAQQDEILVDHLGQGGQGKSSAAVSLDEASSRIAQDGR